MTHQGKNATTSEVSKDRLWRDYVAREENHQTYWAVEAQYVKGSLSPEKKNILRAVDNLKDFDATVLVGTTKMQAQAAQALAQQAREDEGETSRSANPAFKTNSNPNAPSNLLLRQLRVTAAENAQAEEKTLEQLQNYKHIYSSRANLKHKAKLMSGQTAAEMGKKKGEEECDEGDDEYGSNEACGTTCVTNNKQQILKSNVPTPLSPNAFTSSSSASVYGGSLSLAGTINGGSPNMGGSQRVVVSPYHVMNETRCTRLSATQNSNNNNNGTTLSSPTTAAIVSKERTLNNSYCSHYADKDIGIHHYKYSPPARSCQGGGGGGGGASSPHSPVHTYSPNNTNTFLSSASGSPLSRTESSQTRHTQPPHGLPPLALHKAANKITAGSSSSSSANLLPSTLSPLCSSRVYQHELELEASIVSPKRSYEEHGLLTPKMGIRVASATGRKGYGQRIASSHEETYAVRPSLELNERSQHGYRKWNV